jgi:hypothetical protein
MNRKHLAAWTVTGSCMAITGGWVLGTGGCGRSSTVEARTTTVGQELQDLDDARSKGLLTEEEYNKKRRDIMKHK